MTIHVADIRSAAATRWPEILAAAGAAPEILDGLHHPCPKCGGTDRFRMIDREAGALYCNGCFSASNGDGLAAVMWLRDCTFPQAIEWVAERLSILPMATNGHASNGHAHNGHAKPVAKSEGPESLTDQVAWLEDSAGAAIAMANNKPGVSSDAAHAAGCSLVSWPKKAPAGKALECIAFQAYSPVDWAKPVAILLYRRDGQAFPAVGGLKERKTHLVRGSRDGLIIVGGNEALEAADIAWLCEGLPDALTLAPLLPAGQVAVTTVCGAKSFPRDLAEAFSGKAVRLVRDADNAGEAGAPTVGRALMQWAAEVRHVRLPYPVTETGGKDLRDYLAVDGHTFAELQAIADGATPMESAKTSKAPADNGGITNGEIVETDGKLATIPLPMQEVLARILERTGGWPRRVGECLFVDHGGVAWLASPAALFGYFGSTTGIVCWHRTQGCVSKEEVFHELQRLATAYKAVEDIPHEPPMADHYYSHKPIEPGDGTALNSLLDRFNPATPIDRTLILAFLLTLFWGGAAGARPCFVITSKDGRGVGKSKIVEMAGHLLGGLMDFSKSDSIGDMKARLLSAAGLLVRLCLLDNVKSLKLSWAELEALITAAAISGKRMYVGEATRPNTLAWALTLNGASLSTDMAQRAVIIKVSRPTHDGTWEETTRQFVLENRWAIIADLVGVLRTTAATLEKFSRWGAWESGVLARLPDPAAVQAEIMKRQAEVDVEGEESEIVEEFFAEQLSQLDYDVEHEEIFIPSEVAARWFNWATNDNLKVGSVGRVLKQMIEEGRLRRLAASKSRAYGRGFVWCGAEVPYNAPTLRDIKQRFAVLKRGSQVADVEAETY